MRPSTGERLRAEMDFIIELSLVVASNWELQPILDWIVSKTTTMFRAEEGSIRVLNDDGSVGGLTDLKTIQRFLLEGSASGSWPQDIALSVMGYLMTGREEVCATPDLVADDRFPSLRGKDTKIRSMLAVPLKVGDRFTGMLAVTSPKPGRQWAADEVKLLTIVGRNSAVVIEKAQFKIKATEFEDDLRTAKVIQQNLLPSAPLRVGCWEGVGRVVAAHHVGGDAFDYFLFDRSRAAIVIGDVSGKSTPAAMLMSHVQAKVKARCDGRTPIPEAMAIVNEEMLRSAPRYVTLFVGELDASRKLLRYTNAGHNYPLVRRTDGTLEDLNQGGFPIGMFPGAKYEQGECVFGPGDSLLLYSDGITDQEDVRRKRYGEEALRAVWQAEGGRRPHDSIERIFAAVEAHRGNARQSDDMTLLVIGSPAA